MRRNLIDLVLLVIILAGGVLAWQAARERVGLTARYKRLVAAAGDLAVDDPNMVYLKALDTGDPLHFAWRVHLPAAADLNVRCRTGNGIGMEESWSLAAPTDLIARVRLGENESGRVGFYTRPYVGNVLWLDSPVLVQLLREHTSELKVEQAGKLGAVMLDPNSKQHTVLLCVTMPESWRDKARRDLPDLSSTTLVEMTVGP
ncbi:MAG: hypothetical protein ACYC61_28125 [Isosphaeraceae bacterium]